jgi:hypothetical protein
MELVNTHELEQVVGGSSLSFTTVNITEITALQTNVAIRAHDVAQANVISVSQRG